MQPETSPPPSPPRCAREFETYVPGLCTRQHDEHARDEEAMERWGGLLEGLEADPAGPGASQALAALQAEVGAVRRWCMAPPLLLPLCPGGRAAFKAAAN